ncbi:MAG: transposase [bacterium]|nr:transposase [bacterium]
MYKTALHGNTLNIVGRFSLSSKMCSRCGHIDAELTLTNRRYVCQRCGMIKARVPAFFKPGLTFTVKKVLILLCHVIFRSVRPGPVEGPVWFASSPRTV